MRQLDDEFKPCYVISSTWTLHLSKEQLCATFRATGMEFVVANLHEHWCTLRDEESYRLVEIDAWLDTYALQGARRLVPAPFVIIDEALSGQSLAGSHLEERTVFCNASAGFLYAELEAARRILRASDSNEK